MSTTQETPQPELPRYQSHKTVWALKIRELRAQSNGSLLITPAEEGYAPFTVAARFVPKHREGVPQPGWYWVKYDNSYESFSPPDAFETGYSRIDA